MKAIDREGRTDALPDAPLFESDRFDSRSISDEATRAFVETLRRDGVAAIDLGEVGRALCDQVVEDTDPYFVRGGATRVQDAWRRSRAVRELATLPIIHQMLEAAYGRKPFAFQTLNFYRGTEQEIHSDLIHFSSVPERFMCGVWIALEDIGLEAGPLAYVLGSHALPTVTMADAGVRGRSKEGDYGRFVEKFADCIARSNLPKRQLKISKGWAFVWAANLAHGGSEIKNPASTRRSLVVHHYFDQCVYFTPLLSDMERGRLYIRLPADVGAGGVRWPKRSGRRVIPSLRAVVGSALAHILRKPFVTR